MKIVVIVGTRPEAIKLGPVVRELRCRPEHFVTRVVLTAQHREMINQVSSLFQIAPDIDLDLMTDNQSLAGFFARAVAALDVVFAAEQPNWVLVQGDTSTVLAASLVAFWHGVKVGHVEAGLRTDDKRNPFPEEINRRLTSHVADLHFAPTQQARKNLLSEGIPADCIFVTGNTVVDAFLSIVDKGHIFQNPALQAIDFEKRRVVLVTAHRRENFGRPLQWICDAIKAIVQERSDVDVVYPVHLNPNVRDVVLSKLSNQEHIHLLAPLPYDEFVQLMNKCTLILTDSGGIQEEAPALGKPVLVLRDTTERPEAIAAGTAKLVGTRVESIVTHTLSLLDQPAIYQQMAHAQNPFGDGTASRQIVDILLNRGGNERG